jgi:hypothetical protein
MPVRLSKPSTVFGNKHHIMISGPRTPGLGICRTRATISFLHFAFAESRSHDRDGMQGDIVRSRRQQREVALPKCFQLCSNNEPVRGFCDPEGGTVPLSFFVIVIGCAVGFAARLAVALLTRPLHLRKVQPPSPLTASALGIAGALLAQKVGQALGVLPPPHLAGLLCIMLGALTLMSLRYLVMSVWYRVVAV